MNQSRVSSIDIVRGLVMIIMALDHTRDLLIANFSQSPTDLTTTTPALFFSRWITHLCAPTFVFLSGASVYLSMRRNSDWAFLVKRGLWLMVLEFTLVNFALWFDFQFRIEMLQVIAAIGAGLITLAALLKVSRRTLMVASLAFMAGHNALQGIPPFENPVMNFLRNLLFAPGLRQITPDFMFFISYPLLPWIAIMILGFSLGPVFENDRAEKTLMRWGLICLSLFLVARFLNIYGDPFPWGAGKNGFFTVLSFLNVTKYPPSLLFDLLFLGLMFLLLAMADRWPNRIKSMLTTFGQVPIFYYLLHLYLIRAAVFIMVFAQGFAWTDLLFGPFQFGRPASGSGVSLGVVMLIWLTLIILLYPLCRWYGKFKRENPELKLLRYL